MFASYHDFSCNLFDFKSKINRASNVSGDHKRRSYLSRRGGRLGKFLEKMVNVRTESRHGKHRSSYISGSK